MLHVMELAEESMISFHKVSQTRPLAMDELSVGPSSIHQDAIDHQQIHQQADNVADINGGLVIEQPVRDPQ